MPRDKVMEAGVKSLASAFATDEPLHAMDAFWARRRYELAIFPSGDFFGTPEEGFDVGAVYLQG
jgi:hypothetical protein